MSGFNTNIPNHILIGDDKVVFGTVMLGDTYGEVLKFDLDLSGAETEIEGSRGLRAFIINNVKLMADIETLCDEDVEEPGIGDPLPFPLAGVTARVLSAKVGWEAKGGRKLTIKAMFSHSMAVTLEGVGEAPDIIHNPAFVVALDGTKTEIAPI